jgi:polysaccharide export outer membrane protein
LHLPQIALGPRRSTTAAILLTLACAAPRNFVWVDDLGPAVAEQEKPYVIAVGDLVNLRVFNQEQMSARVRVRSDGMISIPLLNDVAAAGLTPVALAAQLQERFKDFVKAPVVTVTVEETRPANVFVAGEVARPGPYPLDSAAPGVLAALTSAGGLTQFARADRIFVLRQGAPPAQRIRFSYDALVQLEGGAARFKLKHGDVVVVE